MSRLNTKEVLEIPIITREDYYCLKLPSDKGRDKAIIITSITDEEDKLLDKGESIIIKRGEATFLVEPRNVYCYGAIDFKSGSEDMEVIADMNWFSSCIDIGFPLPGDYNYEKHCCYTTGKKPTYYDTTSPERVAQYCHAFIGKPSKTVIFKIVV